MCIHVNVCTSTTNSVRSLYHERRTCHRALAARCPFDKIPWSRCSSPCRWGRRCDCRRFRPATPSATFSTGNSRPVCRCACYLARCACRHRPDTPHWHLPSCMILKHMIMSFERLPMVSEGFKLPCCFPAIHTIPAIEANSQPFPRGHVQNAGARFVSGNVKRGYDHLASLT